MYLDTNKHNFSYISHMENLYLNYLEFRRIKNKKLYSLMKSSGFNVTKPHLTVSQFIFGI